jgi:hypothetical protein
MGYFLAGLCLVNLCGFQQRTVVTLIAEPLNTRMQPGEDLLSNRHLGWQKVAGAPIGRGWQILLPGARLRGSHLKRVRSRVGECLPLGHAVGVCEDRDPVRHVEVCERGRRTSEPRNRPGSQRRTLAA